MNRRVVTLCVLTTVTAAATGQAPAPAVPKALFKTVRVERDIDNATLRTALGYFADLAEIKCDIDEEAFAGAGVNRPADVLVKIPRMRDVRLDAALKIVLDQADAGVRFRKGGLTVVPKADGHPILQPAGEEGRKAEAKLKEKLNTVLPPRRRMGNVILRTVVDSAADEAGVEVVIDEPAFRQAGEKGRAADRPIVVPAAPGQTVEQFLTAVLGQADATHETTPYGYVRVFPKPKPQR